MKNVIRLLENGEEDEAKALLIEYVTLDRDDISSWRLLAKLALKNSDFILGSEVFENIIRLESKNPFASSGLVHCYVKCNRTQQALNEIVRFESITSNMNEDALIVLEEHKATRLKLLG